MHNNLPGKSFMRPLLLLCLCLLLSGFVQAAEAEKPSEEAFAAGIEAWEAGNDNAAAEHFRRAAELGNSEAAFRLATMYESGHGVAASMNRAMEWYHRAAEAGSERAQFNLAHHYATGRNVDKDAVAAEHWYRRSAEQDNPHAQMALGLMRFLGDGEVPRDLVEAYRWLTLAVLNFDTNHFRDEAADARRRVIRQMTAEQEAEGRRLVEEHRNR